MHEVEILVVGAGVVGLAVGAELASHGHEVIVAEKANLIGSETSSRNSEVIHAGIYYPKGSLKASLCVEGKRRLYEFCERFHIPTSRPGKLIVATSEDEQPALAAIKTNADACGVNDLELWSAKKVSRSAPELQVKDALFSPSTGIVDSHALMVTLKHMIEDNGGFVVLSTHFLGAEPEGRRLRVTIGGDEPYQLSCKWLINAGGHSAVEVASRCSGFPPAHLPRASFVKGTYFTLRGRAPAPWLVYPVPSEAGLGIHLTLDLVGQARFGPDVQWVDELDYDLDPERAPYFYKAIRRYWPALRDGQLEPGYVGVRPKIVEEGASAGDFLVAGPGQHGIPGLINLFGIESPGLTACLAIGNLVRQMIDAEQA